MERVVHVRIPDDLYAILAEAAERMERTLPWLLRNAADRIYGSPERKNPISEPPPLVDTLPDWERGGLPSAPPPWEPDPPETFAPESRVRETVRKGKTESTSDRLRTLREKQNG